MTFTHLIPALRKRFKLWNAKYSIIKSVLAAGAANTEKKQKQLATDPVPARKVIVFSSFYHWLKVTSKPDSIPDDHDVMLTGDMRRMFCRQLPAQSMSIDEKGNLKIKTHDESK